MSTSYHAIYFAHELTRCGSSGVERLSRPLFDACVDLNPHQIEAVLFAIRSPVSKGVLLADEVGLGKTIENEADQRVYELLHEKFNLFTGVFGASDEVLGSIESGVEFDRRVLDIYQQCRTSGEIEGAFRKLREELDEKIQQKIEETRAILLEHFDEDVHARLRVNLAGTS